MKKLLLVGAGGFGRVVLEHVSMDYECSFIDDGLRKGSIVDGVRVIGKTSDLQALFGEFNQLIVAIGNNRVRERIYNEAEAIGYHFPSIVHQSAYISKKALIGEGCIILNNAVIQNGSVIGKGVIINPGVEIHHDSFIGNYVLIYTNSVIRSLARIGDRSKIGSTLTISNEVSIGPDEVIEDGHSVGQV